VTIESLLGDPRGLTDQLAELAVSSDPVVTPAPAGSRGAFTVAYTFRDLGDWRQLRRQWVAEGTRWRLTILVGRDLAPLGVAPLQRLGHEMQHKGLAADCPNRPPDDRRRGVQVVTTEEGFMHTHFVAASETKPVVTIDPGRFVARWESVLAASGVSDPSWRATVSSRVEPRLAAGPTVKARKRVLPGLVLHLDEERDQRLQRLVGHYGPELIHALLVAVLLGGDAEVNMARRTFAVGRERSSVGGWILITVRDSHSELQVLARRLPDEEGRPSFDVGILRLGATLEGARSRAGGFFHVE
jgi:hypothetical protein